MKLANMIAEMIIVFLIVIIVGLNVFQTQCNSSKIEEIEKEIDMTKKRYCILRVEEVASITDISEEFPVMLFQNRKVDILLANVN